MGEERGLSPHGFCCTPPPLILILTLTPTLTPTPTPTPTLTPTLSDTLAAKKGYFMRGKKSLGSPDPHRAGLQVLYDATDGASAYPNPIPSPSPKL